MNILFNILTSVSSFAISLLASPHISRALGPDGVGQYSYGHSIVSYFSLFVAFGFANYGTQKLARLRQHKEDFSQAFWEIVFCRSLLFLLVASLYFSLAWLGVFDSKVEQVLYLVLTVNILTSALDLSFLLQSVEKFNLLCFLTISIRICYVVLLYLFVRTPDDLVLFCWLATGYMCILAALQWLFVPKVVSKPIFKNLHILNSLKEAFFFFLPDIAISIFMLADRTMLGSMKNTNEVAYYEQAYKVVYMGVAVLFAVSPVLLSRMSYLHAVQDREAIDKKMVQVANLYFFLGLPEMVGLYIISPFFMTVFFGPGYEPCVMVSYFMIPLILLMPISSYLGSMYYVPNGKVKNLTFFYFSAAIVNVIINVLLIPPFGASGAALASTLCQLVLSALFIGFSIKDVKYRQMVKTCVKPLLATVIMAVVLVPLNYLVLVPRLDDLWISVIDIFSGSIIYFLSAILLREPLTMNGLRFLYNKIRKKQL